MRLNDGPRPWQIAALVAAAFLVMPANAPSAHGLARSHGNPIVRENRLPGTRTWQLDRPATGRQIEGYAWATSAGPGDTLRVSVSTSAPRFSARIYRLGWYRGAGGRLVKSIGGIRGHHYATPTPVPHTGLIECRWPAAFSVRVAPSWTSGLYVVKLTASTGYESWVPFVVRSPRASTYAFVHAVDTDEAYNRWGGKSLYASYTPPGLTSTEQYAQRARKVSFDRPLEEDFGIGFALWWEYSMIRWMEKNGYDVSYLSDVDVHEHPTVLRRYRAIIIAGHSEYWSKPMRDGYDAAVAHRVNLAVFAGNTGYWQVRFEGSRLGRDHVMVCYREPAEDPARRLAPSTVTVEWRDPLLHRPESQLLGAMWIGFFANDLNHPGFPWVVRDAVPWLFAGTGLKPGESVPKMVGYEYDAVVPGAPTPPNMHVISASPVETDTGKKQVANSTLATAYSGARIFNAGTIQWSWGLDDFGPLHLAHNRRGGTSRQVQRITKNLFAAFRTRGVALPTVRVRVHGKRKGTSFVAPVRVYLNATHGAAWIRYRLGAGRVWQRYRAPLSVRSAGDVALQSEAVTSHGDHGPVRNTRLRVTR